MSVSNTRRLFTRFALAVNHAVAQPSMFFIATFTIIAWLITGPLFQWDDTWQLFINTTTTIITFLMVFLIHHAQHVHWLSTLSSEEEEEIMAQHATRFVVEYIYQRKVNGSPSRCRLESSVQQLAHPAARSETAVLAYLRKRHPQHDITILSVEFQNASGAVI